MTKHVNSSEQQPELGKIPSLTHHLQYFSSFSLLHTDTWGQLVLLTTILNHKACINTSRQVLEKTLNALHKITFFQKLK